MYLNCILLLKVELLCTVSSAFYITIRLSASISILSCLLSFVLSKIKLPMDLTVQIGHCTDKHFLHKLNHFLCMPSHLLSHKRNTSIVRHLSEIDYVLNKTVIITLYQLNPFVPTLLLYFEWSILFKLQIDLKLFCLFQTMN